MNSPGRLHGDIMFVGEARETFLKDLDDEPVSDQSDRDDES